MKTHTISVIIPNYNNAKFLTQCVESICSQSYPIHEIVIVDDCSTDNSKRVIQELMCKHNNIIPVFLPANGGVSNARNQGFLASSGEIVTFIDADDFYFNKNKIKNEISVIEKHFPEEVIAYSYTKLVDVNGIPTDEYNLNYFEGDIFTKLLEGRGKTAFIHSYCFTRKQFEKCGPYDKNSNLYEDFDLLLALASHYKFFSTHDTGIAYRQTGTGLSSQSQEKHNSRLKELRSKYIRHLPFFRKLQIKMYWLCILCYRKVKSMSLKSIAKKTLNRTNVGKLFYRKICRIYDWIIKIKNRKVFNQNSESVVATLQKILDESGEFFFFDMGTLLGIIREGKILKHDIDIDIGVHIPEENIKSFQEHLISSGCSIYKRYLLNGTDIAEESYLYRGVKFDVSYYRCTSETDSCILFYHKPNKPVSLENMGVVELTCTHIARTE